MFGMVSIASFLQFMAALLVFGSVNCESVVGHGKHKMVNGEITELKGNTMIAKNDDDIKRYMKLDGSCDVEMDANKNIILWYKKDSKTKKNGCSVDFVTKKEGEISLEFGIQNTGSLTNCIDKFGVKTVGLNVMFMDNVLSFAFSLTNEEFKELKNGPKEGKDSDCSDKGKCKEGCFNNKVLYSIGWKEWMENMFKSKYNFLYFINTVGDEFKGDLGIIESDTDLKEASFKLLINGEKFGFEKAKYNSLSTSCYKKLSKPERWNIVDKTYKDENLKSLLTFHIMPVKAMRETMQKTFCKDNPGKNCDDNASMQECNKMFIKFDKKHFQLIVPSIPPTTKNYITTISSNINISSTNESSTAKTTIKPKQTEGSGIGIVTIIMIIVGITMVLLVICFLIWFFVLRGKDKDKTGHATVRTKRTGSNFPNATNIGGTYTSIKPKRSPSTGTKMNRKHSKAASGVDVPSTKVD